MSTCIIPAVPVSILKLYSNGKPFFPAAVTTTVTDFPNGLYKAIKKESKLRLGIDVAEQESARIDAAAAQESLSGLPAKTMAAAPVEPLK